MKVVVNKAAVEGYTSRGYSFAQELPSEVLGPQAWALLSDEHRSDLVVLEMDDAQHEKLNKPPKRFMLAWDSTQFVATNYRISCVEVLESGADSGCSYVAPLNTDKTIIVDDDQLHDSPREAAREAKISLELEAAKLRAWASDIDEFLRRWELA